jgi:hypothetical protein
MNQFIFFPSPTKNKLTISVRNDTSRGQLYQEDQKRNGSGPHSKAFSVTANPFGVVWASTPGLPKLWLAPRFLYEYSDQHRDQEEEGWHQGQDVQTLLFSACEVHHKTVIIQGNKSYLWKDLPPLASCA